MVSLAATVIGVSNTLARICIIMSTLPTASSCYMMADAANVGTGPSTTLIFWSMILFLPALIMWFAILDGLHLFVEE